MKKDQLISKYRQIFTDIDVRRISISEEDSDLSITVDVHGMKCSQAHRFINNVICLPQRALKIMIIHGYNNGTAIKDMLAKGFDNNRVIEKFYDLYNQGVTYMVVA